MSEEPLVFNGKKYISSRRASEISGYHIDYLGQLSRSGKIESEMVGRNRYVCEESLFTYLHSLNAKMGPETVVVSGVKKESLDVPKNKPESDTSITPRSASITPTFSNISQTFGNTVTLQSRFPNGLFERTLLVVVTALIATTFAMPQTRSAIVALVESVGGSGISERADQILGRSSLTASPYTTSFDHNTLARLDNQYFAIVHSIQDFFLTLAINVREFVLGVGDRGWEAINRLRNKDTQTVPTVFSPVTSTTENVPSGISDTSMLSEDEIRKIFNEELDKRFAEGEAPKEGMVVVPSSGSVSGDAAIKERIRNSFSDEVKVELDASKTAGVVRPQFKSPTDDSYIFLLVPVQQ